MSEYIELEGLSGSSSEESVFNSNQGVRRRPGYISVPINSSSSSLSSSGSQSKPPFIPRTGVATATWSAGGPSLEIAAGQAGLGISQIINPSTPSTSSGNIWIRGNPVTGNDLVASGDLEAYEKAYAEAIEKAKQEKLKTAGKIIAQSFKQVSRQHQQKPYNRPIQTGVVLPFSNNIGPGNSIQTPQTNADAIAAEHDHRYENKENIPDADLHAIADFGYEAVYGNNPVSQNQAIIGATGLAIKTGVERVVGHQLYPRKYATYSSSWSSPV